MAKHKRQSDLETDGAPSSYRYPDLPSPPPVTSNTRDTNQTEGYWPAVSNHDSGIIVTSSLGSTSVRSSMTDSGFGTTVTTEADDNSSCRLSSLFNNISLCSADSALQSRTSSSSRRSFNTQSLNSPRTTPSSSRRSSELAETMAAIEADPEMCFRQDEDGDTILHLAVLHNKLIWIVMILQTLTSPLLLNLKNSLSQTVLHLAVLGKQLKVVRLLMAHGASLEARDKNGNTPLHLACRDGDLDCVRQLTTPLNSKEIESSKHVASVLPQDPDVRNYHGDGCIHLAAAAGHIDIVQYLIESPSHRANVNFPDGRSGRTILHNAVESRDMGLISFLLQYRYTLGVDIDAQAYCGNTALSLALGRGYRDVAEFLVMAGAVSDNTSFVSDADAFSDVSSESSIADVSMESEDFEDSDYYDDLCVKGSPVYTGARRTW